MVVVGFGCFANYLAVTGIEFIFLSIASLLNNTLPIFVMIVAYFMLGERMNKIQMVAIVFALTGVVLMSMNALTKDAAQDTGKGLSVQAFGFILILASEILGAMSYTSIKKITDVNVFTISFMKIALIFSVSIFYMFFEMIANG